MSEVHVRKTRAGSDSAGHHWPEDGAVVPVPYEHALLLAAIPDGDFVIVDVAVDENELLAPPVLAVVVDEPAEAPAAKPRPSRSKQTPPAL